jgi:RimJ/RimL family protein N-acetyltransferase
MTILTTARLRLEPVADAHFDELLAMNGIPEVMRYITGKPDTPDDTLGMIARAKARWAAFGFTTWAIFEAGGARLIGLCAIMHLGGDPANSLELGWRLRPEAWGKGYASEATRRIAQFAFDELDAQSVCAVCDPDNLASRRVMERLGMRDQGQAVWNDHDVAVYELTRADLAGSPPA